MTSRAKLGFSDFDVALAARAPQQQTAEDSRAQGGRYKVKIDKSVRGTINGGGPGVAGFTYNTTGAQFSFGAGIHGLFVQSATPQCSSGTYHGLRVQQFERIDLGGSADISPAQRISSP